MELRLRKLVPTPDEFWEMVYRRVERIGILTNGSPGSTLAQDMLARREADAWLEQQPLQTCLNRPDDQQALFTTGDYLVDLLL